MATFKVVEPPQDKSVPVNICVIAVINSHSFTSLSFFFSLKLIGQKYTACHITEKLQKANLSVLKTC